MRDVGDLGQLRQRHAGSLVAAQLQYREIDVVHVVQHVVEHLVAFGPIAIRFAEQNIEHDGGGFLPGDALQQFAVHRARPGPATRHILHGRDAGFVYIDDDDVGVGLEPGCKRAHEHIRKTAIRRAERVDPYPIECDEQHQNQGQQVDAGER